MSEIIKKQAEMAVYYEKRLGKAEKENKKIRKRLVQARNNGKV